MSQYLTLGFYLDQPFEKVSSRQIDNLLPFPVDIICGSFQSKIGAFQSIHVPGNAFSIGSTMNAFYLGKLVTSGTVTRGASRIRIGDVLSQSIEKTIHPMKGDIASITFHNTLPMPVNVYYQGNKIAVIGGRDMKGYFGGSSSVLNITNETFGFYVRDQLKLTISGLKDPRQETDWMTVEIVDPLTTDIFLGTISMRFTPAPFDSSIYRYDEPQMGFTLNYYSNAGRKDPYDTYPTNPYAPF